MNGRAHSITSGVAAVMVISATLALPAMKDATPASSEKYYKMKQVQVIDPSGFSKPMPVEDLLIPTDWKFQSNVQWANRGCFVDLAAVGFEAQSADGKLVLEAFPSFSWQFAKDPAVQKYLVMENQAGAKAGLKPCPVNQPVPAAEVLRKVVLPQYRPGKEVVTVEPMPELEKFMNSRVQNLEQQSARAGQAVQFRADAAKARLKYDLDGQAVEEWVTAVSVAQASSVPTGSGPTLGVDCRAVMLYAFRAPLGQLDGNAKLFEMIRSSLRMEQDWQRQYLAIVSKLAEAQQGQRIKRAQLIAQFQQKEINTIQSVVANSQRGANQAFAGADQIIRGVEPYRDPATGKTYELSNLYGHAWLNGNNEYVMSDDPNFIPQSVFSGDWKPLEHVQPVP